MKVLIVEGNSPLSGLWARTMERAGASVAVAPDQDRAADLLAVQDFDIVVLNVVLERGSALAVADVAQYRQPRARIIFVTSSTFFSDGSIFNICANACACVPASTPPEDLALVAAHYARARVKEARAS